MRRLALTVLAVAALTGCGASHHTAQTTTEPLPTSATGGGTVLYAGGAWAVVVKDEQAFALHFVGRSWHVDRTNRVHVTFLGPHAVDAAIPQVAATLSASAPLVESGLWVDGTQLDVKGGGLTPTKGTIYGAPTTKLKPGEHLAVAYARTATSGTAVAKLFRAR